MRKIVTMLLLPLLLCACGGQKEKRAKDTASSEQTPTEFFEEYVHEKGDEWLTQLGYMVYDMGMDKKELINSIIESNPDVDKKVIQDYINDNWSKIEETILYCERRDYGDAVVSDSIVEEAPAVEVAPAPQSNSQHWTGAKSLDELKQKINGTSWYVIDKNSGRVFNLDFKGGNCTISISPASYQDWSSKTVSCKYQINRNPEGNAAEIVLGKTYDDEVSFSGYVIVFEPGGAKRAVLFQFNNICGELRQGHYTFNDDI